MRRRGDVSRALLPALAFFASACAHVGGLSRSGRFSGLWDNPDAHARGIRSISVDASKIRVRGACAPTPCDWGEADATAYGPDVSSDPRTDARALLAQYKTSFSETVLILRPAGADELEVESYTRFTDQSGRAAYAYSETLRRAAPATTKDPKR